MKKLRSLFIGAWFIVATASLANAGFRQNIKYANAFIETGELNNAAKKLINMHSELSDGMRAIIQQHSPHSLILINKTNCSENVQRRGKTFESPIIISAWREGSVDRITSQVIFEYTQQGIQFRAGEFTGCSFYFYGPTDEEDRTYCKCCCCFGCRGDRKEDMEKELKKFLATKIKSGYLKKNTLPARAQWWNHNFCRTAANLLTGYTQKLYQNFAGFTLVDAYYFLMTYKVYVESDGGTRGQLVFSQENFEATRTAVHTMIANLLLHPQVNVQAKQFVLTALANWNHPVYQNVGKVGNVDVRPIGYYQIEIGLLDNTMRVEHVKYIGHLQAIEQPIQIMQKAQGEWNAAYQNTLRTWERQFQQILQQQSQLSTSGHKPSWHYENRFDALSGQYKLEYVYS